MKTASFRSVLTPLLRGCRAPVLHRAVLRRAEAAAVPKLVNFSGALTDLNGKPLSGVVGVTFLLYKDEQGGAPLWMETQNVQPDKSGRYSVMLGSSRSEGLPTDAFVSGEARWLGVQAQGQAEQPRVLLLRKELTMRTKTLVRLVFITSLAALAADKVRPLKVKVGLWEVTTTATTSGDLPIPAGLLEKLTAAQRVRVKERMQAKTSEAPRITTRRQCLTREQLDKGVTFGEDPKSCTRRIVASTDNKLEMRIACVSQSQDIKSEGTFQVAAIDSERVKGSVHLTLTGDRTAVSKSAFIARWIGPTCGSTR